MNASKNGWDQVDWRKRDRRAHLPLHPLFQRQGLIASVDWGSGEPFSLLGPKRGNHGPQS